MRGSALAAVAAIQAAVLALWLRFNAPPPGGGLEFPFDFVYQFYPLTELAVERLARGELPLWNPYGCTGIPLLATLQVAALYPGTWLSLLLGAERALPLLMLLESALGGVLGFALFRALGNGGFAATLGGILYVFACLLGQSFWPAALSTLLWLPWLLLCVEKLVRAWTWRWWWGLSGGTALQLLAGYPQYTVYSFYLVAPFAALRIVQEWRAGRRPRAQIASLALGLGLAVALGAGLAAVQLLPARELIAHSARAVDLTPEQVHYLGPPLSIGGFLRNAIDPQPKLISIGYRHGTGYVGIATLLLAAIGLVARIRAPLTWLFLGLGVAGLVLSQGYHGPSAPLYELYTALPLAGRFRTPERLQLLPLFALIALAVAGFDAFTQGRGAAAQRGEAERRQAPARLGPALAAALLLAGAVALLGGAGAAWRAGAACVLLFAGFARRAPVALARGAQALMLLLVCADLWYATGAYGSLRAFPAAWARTLHVEGYAVAGPEELARLGGTAASDRIALVRVDPIIGAGPVGRLYRVSCYEPLVPIAWRRLWQQSRERSPAGLGAGPERFPSFYDVASVSRALIASWQRRPRSDELAERTRRLRARMRSGSGPSANAPPDLRVEIVENPDALPRAYVVHDYAVRPSTAVLERVLHGGFAFHRSVLLDRVPGPFERSASAAGYERAEIVAYAPERVEIEAASTGDGLLVLTDTFYPGWRARVDGSEVDIFRANGLFRAVRVPAGRHRVVFEYVPASVRVGARLSVASFVALCLVPAGVSLRARLRRRR